MTTTSRLILWCRITSLCLFETPIAPRSDREAEADAFFLGVDSQGRTEMGGGHHPGRGLQHPVELFALQIQTFMLHSLDGDLSLQQEPQELLARDRIVGLELIGDALSPPTT